MLVNGSACEVYKACTNDFTLYGNQDINGERSTAMRQITIGVLASLLLIQGSLVDFAAAFSCTIKSPVGPAEYSKTNPKIPLTHIFCGQIVGKKAEGFHSAPGDKFPDSARTVNNAAIHSKSNGQISCCDNCDTEVFKSTADSWIAKNKKQAQCFFRWSIDDTVTNLQTVYNKCGLKKEAKTEACVKDYLTDNKYAIQYLLDNKTKDVVSAFPVLADRCSGAVYNYKTQCNHKKRVKF